MPQVIRDIREEAKKKGGGRPKKKQIEFVMEQLTHWDGLDFDGTALRTRSDDEIKQSVTRRALEMLPHLLRMSAFLLDSGSLKVGEQIQIFKFIKELADAKVSPKEVKAAMKSFSDEEVEKLLEGEELADVD